MRAFSHGVLAAGLLLSSAHAEECGPLKIVSTIQLVPSQSGNAEFVPVEIAGVRKLMLLDTGASFTMITQAVVDELKLETHRSDLKVFDVTGARSDRFASAPFAIGRLRAPKADFIVQARSTRDDPDFAGILGANILSGYDLSIDFAAHKLDLIDPKHCEGRVVYWPERPLAIIPFKLLWSGHIVLPVTLEGRTVDAILDTGAFGSTLEKRAAERDYGLVLGSEDTPVAGTLNDKDGLTVWSHRFKSLKFEGVEVANPNFTIIPDEVSRNFDLRPETGSRMKRRDDQLEPPVLLGMNVLKHLHVYIAYKENKLYLTPASSPAGAAQAQTSN